MAKIIFSANTSWYIYNFRKNTVLRLISSGHQVFCVSPTDGYSKKLCELGAVHLDVYMDSGGTNIVKDLRTLYSYIKVYVRLKPDVILNFTPKSNIYSTFSGSLVGSKIINNIAGLGSMFDKLSIPSIFARLLFRLSQPLASLVFFQNEDDKDILLKLGAVKPCRSQRLFGSGVDLDRFNYSFKAYDGITKFIFVGRLLTTKGVYEYLDSAKKLKEIYGDSVEFIVVGLVDNANPNSIDFGVLKKMDSSKIVSFKGSTDSVEDILKTVDAIVLPSYYREGVPKSLLEAGAMGKAIITTDNVGCRETVVHGSGGYICEPKSKSSLINAMLKYISLDEKEREEMSLRSRDYIASKFDEKNNIKAYMNAINGLCS